MHFARGVRDCRPVQRQRWRRKFSVENRFVQRAQNLAVKHAVPFDGIGDLLLEPPQINVVHLHDHVQRPRSYRQRTVQIHIDEWRIDMEVVYCQHAVLQRVVAFHSGQEIAPVTAPMGADIPHHRGIVQRARHRDDIVDIAGNRLVRRHERRKILQPRAHGIDPQIDAPFAGQADDALRQPCNLSAVFHGERIDAHAVQASADSAPHRPVRLLEKLAVRGEELGRNRRILDGAAHRAAKIGDPRHIKNGIYAREQGNICMGARKRQIQRLLAQYRAFQPNLPVVFQMNAQIIDHRFFRRMVKGRGKLRRRNVMAGHVPAPNAAVHGNIFQRIRVPGEA